MTTMTFNKAAGVWLWFVFGLFGKRQECYACGNRVKPSNVGAFKVLDDGSLGVWHGALPCILALKNIDGNSDRSVMKRAINDGE